MTKVVLTGVAGFIGAHTLKHFLVETDWEVIGIDSLEHHGDYRRIESILKDSTEEEKKRFTFIKQDLAKMDPKDFAKKLGKVEHIINMAAESHVDRSIEEPVPFIKNNVDLCVNMLEVARIIKPESFIQISTDEVYGPMYNDNAYKEWDAEVPSNPYSASKAAQEMIAISYWRTYGVPLVITNTMNNIGEMQDIEKFLPLLIDAVETGKPAKIHAIGDEIGSRFYLHARNHADALKHIIEELPPHAYDPDKGDVKPDRYHVVGDTRLNNLELAQMVADVLKKPLKYKFVDSHTARPGHDMHYGLNGDKLRNLGWNPPVAFDEALETTVKHYLANPEWLEWELGVDEESKPKAKAKK
jgi:dTDP-glucose 4,6-dehydratase